MRMISTAMPEKIAPATKNAPKIVLFHGSRSVMAKIHATTIAEERQVRDHGQEQIHEAGREIGRNGDDVPDDGRLPAAVDDDVEHPIGAAEVNDDKQRAAGESDGSDELGHAGHRRPP